MAELRFIYCKIMRRRKVRDSRRQGGNLQTTTYDVAQRQQETRRAGGFLRGCNHSGFPEARNGPVELRETRRVSRDAHRAPLLKAERLK